MEQLHFRHLVGEVLPEKRVKQIAAEYDVEDGPDDKGEMYTRPCVIGDPFPKPYPNEESENPQRRKVRLANVRSLY